MSSIKDASDTSKYMHKLSSLISSKNINLTSLIFEYDQGGGSGRLSLDQFDKLVLKIDPSRTLREKDLVYNKYSKDEYGRSFFEYTPFTREMDNYRKVAEKVRNFCSDLSRRLEEKKTNLVDYLKNEDSNGLGYIGPEELSRIVRSFSIDIENKDFILFFNIMNCFENDVKIMYNEFEKSYKENLPVSSGSAVRGEPFLERKNTVEEEDIKKVTGALVQMKENLKKIGVANFRIYLETNYKVEKDIVKEEDLKAAMRSVHPAITYIEVENVFNLCRISPEDPRVPSERLDQLLKKSAKHTRTDDGKIK